MTDVISLSRAVLFSLMVTGCAGASSREPDPLTVATSALGREGTLVRQQVARFAARHPEIPIEVRSAPDEADTRHQLYVHWLNAYATEPDVLQLDVVWTAEFAAAGWILPLDRFEPVTDAFFPASIAANTWNGRLFALPWFVDVGMLYWRTDLAARAPADFATLSSEAAQPGPPSGFVWQGARYEGLVTVFLEHLGGFGGRILDDDGRVVVDSEAAVRALTYMRDAHPPERLRARRRAVVAGGAGALRVPERPRPLHAQLAVRRAAPERSVAVRGGGTFRGGADARGARRRLHRRARRCATRHQRAQPRSPSRPGR